METNRIRKTIAILLIVMFLLTVTAGAVGAVQIPPKDFGTYTPAVISAMKANFGLPIEGGYHMSYDTSLISSMAKYKPGNGIHD